MYHAQMLVGTRCRSITMASSRVLATYTFTTNWRARGMWCRAVQVPSSRHETVRVLVPPLLLLGSCLLLLVLPLIVP